MAERLPAGDETDDGRRIPRWVQIGGLIVVLVALLAVAVVIVGGGGHSSPIVH